MPVKLDLRAAELARIFKVSPQLRILLLRDAPPLDLRFYPVNRACC